MDIGKAMIGVFMALLLLTSVSAWALFGEDRSTYTMAPSEHTIIVAGSATVEIEPDQAEMYISVETTNDNAQTAQQENAQISEQVMNALLGMGLREEDIETVSYQLYEDRMWNYKSEEYESNGYRVTHTLKVTTDDITSVGAIADTAVGAGATGVGSITFGLSDEKQQEVNEQTLSQAVDEAENKAAILADAAGIGVGSVIGIQENNYEYTPVYKYAPVAMAMDESAGAETNIAPGDVSTSMEVTVMFEIN